MNDERVLRARLIARQAHDVRLGVDQTVLTEYVTPRHIRLRCPGEREEGTFDREELKKKTK